MIASVNFLRLLGLDHKVAETLNSHAENHTLWGWVQGGAGILSLVVVLGIFAQATLLTNNIGNSAILMAALFLNFVGGLVVIEAVQLAQGYLDGKKLTLFPEGMWVMMEVT